LLKAEADKKLFEQKLGDLKQRADVQGQRARLQIEETRNATNSLEDKLRSAAVRASIAGTIYALPVRPGMFVHEGDTLAELADLTHIRVRIYVDEPDLGSLNAGQPVEITWDGLPNRGWTGHVEQLPRTIVSHGARSVGEVLCSVDDKNAKLLPNTNVNVRIRTAQRNNSLTVTRSAVRTEGSKHYVFVVDHGRVHKTEVNIGISNSADYEVLSGITETDIIALPGSSELHDGSAVTVI
jgi:RND family efflux transporter MFP subunit